MHLYTGNLAASAAPTTKPSLAPVTYSQVQPSQLGPEVIISIVFGCIMVVIGASGLWQGYLLLSCTFNHILIPLP